MELWQCMSFTFRAKARGDTEIRMQTMILAQFHDSDACIIIIIIIVIPVPNFMQYEYIIMDYSIPSM